jgi:glycosyltransferase involved in cell wall biosynthesis
MSNPTLDKSLPPITSKPLTLPRISIVTPSFNQAAYLEDTIKSVIEPAYPNLEYGVVDGGSTDGSADLIRRHAQRLAFWISEPDQGQYDAINKGFGRTTGEIMGWLNSDDQYLPWTLAVVGEVFATFPEVQWVTSLCPLHLDEQGKVISCGVSEGFSREGFFRGENLPAGNWHATGWIQQESTFWRRSLWNRVGGKLDLSCKIAADFDLWARFFREAELFGLTTPLAAFRLHAGQKTDQQFTAYCAEARDIFIRQGGKFPRGWESFVNNKLAKLIRWLDRKYQQRLQPFPIRKTLVHRGRAGGWRMKTN